MGSVVPHDVSGGSSHLGPTSTQLLGTSEGRAEKPGFSGALSPQSLDISGPLFPHVTSPHDFPSKVGGLLTWLPK